MYIDYLENFSLWLEANYISPKAQLLYMRILMVFNKVEFPESIQLSNYKIMDMLSSSMTTVSKAREELIENGFITYEPGKRGKPSKYFLVKQDNICYNNKSDGKDGIQKEVQKEEEPKAEKPRARKKKDETAKEAEINPEEWGLGNELTETFKEWLTYKKERKDKYTPTGLKMLVSEIRNKLNVYSEHEISDLIKKCIAKGWKGIIWDLLPERVDFSQVEYVDPLDELEAQYERSAEYYRARGECI